MKHSIILGTRGSNLALIQTGIVKVLLLQLYPHITINVTIINTTGDKNMNPVPLDSVGKDWFTKELDKALLDGTIDAAVHSLKDISEMLPKDLTIAAIPAREDAREAFISRNKVLFKNIQKKARIGTDSTRRKAQLLYKRPDMHVESIRGNVNRRLEKLENGDYDGIFLAVAGLKRLGLKNVITEYFSETDIVPSPGQGALAVVIKKDNTDLLTLFKKLNHTPTVKAVKAERAFSKMFGGGCSMPIGAYANYKNNKLTLHGMVASLDGKHVLKDSLKNNSLPPVKLGKTLAVQMMKKSSLWFHFNEKQYVIITSPKKKNKYLSTTIKLLGLQPYSYPTIAIKKLPITNEIREYVGNIQSFDWIIFTSSNGVIFFIEIMKKLGVTTSDLKKIKIAAVGKKTREELEKCNLQVAIIPTLFTSKDLANKLIQIKNKKILLPRGNLANPFFRQQLEKKGAEVIDLLFYKTELVNSKNKKVEDLISENSVRYITFTSPSAVKGFLKNVKNKNIYSIPVISIGPTTTRELKKSGFKTIATADTYTEEGMIAKLKEILV